MPAGELHDINLTDPKTLENPYPVYEVLQREAPVYFAPEVNMYVLTRYEDIETVIGQPELFTKGGDVQSLEAIVKHPEARALYEKKGWLRYMPLAENIPKHRRYRELLDPILTPAAVRKREPFIREVANELVDRWIDRGEIEFMGEFAVPMPVTVISEYLGFPRSDMLQLKKWSAAFAIVFGPGLTLEQEIAAVNDHIDLQHYIHDVMQQRRRNPRDDIVSRLVQAEFNDPETGSRRPLTDVEIIGIVDHLLSGGNESTAHALCSGLWLLFRFPTAYAQIQAAPGKIRNFVEEVLRIESPTQGLFRYVTQDVEIRGVKIPKGAMLNIRFAAGNRDATQFTFPENLDLGRPNTARQMAFSHGEHHCPGASLTRLEQVCAWDILVSRLRNIRPAPGKNDYSHAPSFVLRGLKAVHMQFDRAA